MKIDFEIALYRPDIAEADDHDSQPNSSTGGSIAGTRDMGVLRYPYSVHRYSRHLHWAG